MRKVRTTSSLALATLASLTLLSGSMMAASDNEYRLLSVRQTYAIRELTAGEGPIHVGFAHGDYSDTEIEEWFESGASVNLSDKVAQEQSQRLCRHVGTFSGVTTDEILNDGKPIYTKCNWLIAAGDTIKLWAYNQSGATLTTGARVNANGSCTIKFV